MNMVRKSKLLLPLILILPMMASGQWNTLDAGITHSLSKVYFPSEATGYILPVNGPVFRSLDGGKTWDSLSGLTLSTPSYSENDVSFVNDSTGFIATNDGLYQTIYKTEDWGENWTDIRPADSLYGKLMVQLFNADIGYAFNNQNFNDRFWITVNGGQDWTERNLTFELGTGTSTLPSMHMVNDSTGYLVGGDGTFLYHGVIGRTQDSGKTWSKTTLNTEYSLVNSIHFPNADTGYTVSRNGDIHRSTNNGQSWDSITHIELPVLSKIYFVSGMTGYVISISQIFKTTDGGENWIEQASGTSESLADIFFSHPDTGYIVGSNGTVLTTKMGTGGIFNNAGQSGSVKLYPNPANGQLFVGWPSDAFHIAQMTIGIYDQAGRLMLEQVIRDGEAIDLPLESGMYYCVLRNRGELYGTGKVIINE